jgi:hypothetical protein
MKSLIRSGSGMALAAVLARAALAPTPAQAGGFAFVTNGNDAGKGSLRYALEEGKTRVRSCNPTHTCMEGAGL